MFGRALTRALTLATAASLLLTSVAFADQFQTDKDVITTDAQEGALNIQLPPGGTTNVTVGALINAQGRSVAFPVPVNITLSANPSSILGTPNPTNGVIAGYYDPGDPDANPPIPQSNLLTTTVSVTAPTSTANCGSTLQGKITFTAAESADQDRLSSGGSVEQQINLSVAGGTCPSSGGSTNTAPSIAFTTGPTTVNEHATADHTFSFSITDPDANTWSFAAGYPTCGLKGTLSGSPSIDPLTKTGSFTCEFDDGVYPLTDSVSTVAVKVTDGTAASNELTRVVTINNVAPTATIGNNGPNFEGSAVTVSLTSPSDPSAADTTAGFTYSFACDGTNFAAAVSNSTTCTFADNGTYTVGGRVTDKDGDSNTYTTSVVVDNALPVVAQPRWQSRTINCGQSATLENISFSDAGVNDRPWALTIDWDAANADNSTNFSTSVTTQGLQDNQSHIYNTPGTYTAIVTVTDKDGGAGSNRTASTAALTVNQLYTTTFLSPLDGSTPSQLIANTMKKGRVVPIKVTIRDNCTGQWVNDPTANVNISVKTATYTANSTDAVETFSDAGASSNLSTAMRFNADSTMASGGFWIYNLDTNGLTIGTQYEVRPMVGTAPQVTSNFALLKPTK